jgi:hypothetical protein
MHSPCPHSFFFAYNVVTFVGKGVIVWDTAATVDMAMVAMAVMVVMAAMDMEQHIIIMDSRY